MNATCLHCHKRLKANDVVEAFPVGTRVAYDPAKQRYWVVCHKCGKWNMAPLDDDGRAGAIEVLERWWRGTSQHYTAGEIGVGRYSDKFSVVRVGAASWPEFAAWRYGEAIQRRNYQYSIRASLSTAFLVGTVSLNWLHPVGALALFFALPISQKQWPQLWLGSRSVICKVPTDGGRRGVVRTKHLQNLELEQRRSGWVLNATHDQGTSTLESGEALRLMHYSLSRINYLGASKRQVEDALTLIESTGGTEATVEKLAGVAPRQGGEQVPTIARYPAVMRVALEIATREQRERLELENEIAVLAHEWREAEEIASISEGLLK